MKARMIRSYKTEAGTHLKVMSNNKHHQYGRTAVMLAVEVKRAWPWRAHRRMNRGNVEISEARRKILYRHPTARYGGAGINKLIMLIVVLEAPSNSVILY